VSSLQRAGVVTGLLVWLTAAIVGAAGQVEKMTPATAAAIRSWVDAVKTHVPGRVDSPLITVARLSYAQREELNVGIEFFLHILVGGNHDTKGNNAAKAIAEITHLARNPDVDSFLKRAVILHSDAAEYIDNFPSPSGVAEPRPPRSRTVEMRSGPGRTSIELEDSVPPLLTSSRVVLHNDGQVLNEEIASWNWPFARRLLDLLGVDKRRRGEANRSRAAMDPFVSAWYHAATAYMFATGSYGDVTPHLYQGAERLPDDAWMLFDRGCYAEILGLPMHQVLVPERDTVGQRTSGHSYGNSQGSLSVRIPPAEKTNAEAERLFRRALSIDPSLVEARVRLARLLDLRKRHEEAAAELKTALAGNATPVVKFYAHLFAGRATQSLGQSDIAAGHYQDALALFPDAQSALLASSQLALFRSNVAATLEPVQRLGAGSAVYTADPWWRYYLAAGRDADALLKAVWTSVPR
jgi:tetratricopeptide (TPR) repeat protein